MADQPTHEVCRLCGEHSATSEFVEIEAGWRRDAQRNHRARSCNRIEDGVQANATGQAGVDPRARMIESAAALGRETLREPAHGCGVRQRNLDPFEAFASVQEDGAGSVDEDVGHARGRDDWLQDAEALAVAPQMIDDFENGGAVG